MKVQLFTFDGDEVTEAVLIPEFNAPPQVVFWGTRVFAYNDVSTHETVRYREAFFYALPDNLDNANARVLVSDGS